MSSQIDPEAIMVLYRDNPIGQMMARQRAEGRPVRCPMTGVILFNADKAPQWMIDRYGTIETGPRNRLRTPPPDTGPSPFYPDPAAYGADRAGYEQACAAALEAADEDGDA